MSGRRRLLHAAASAALLLAAVMAVPEEVHIGVMVPLAGEQCERGTQYLNAIKFAETELQQQDSWPSELTLNVTTIDSPDPYTGWRNALTYINALEGEGSRPVALLGPTSSDGAVHAAFLGGEYDLPVLSFSATGSDLTLVPDGIPPGTLFRVCQSDATAAEALWKVIDHYGWEMFSVMYVRNQFGRTFFERLEEVNAREDAGIRMANELTFTSMSLSDVNANLRALRRSSARVVVLACNAEDARFVLRLARAQGMTGKGWVWLGEGWVHTETWRLAPTDEIQEAVADAMSGALGVLPDDGAIQTYAGGALARFTFTPGVTAGDPVMCPTLLTSTSRNLPADPYTAYAFDALWAVGSTASALFSACQTDTGPTTTPCVTGAGVSGGLSEGVPQESPLTGQIRFLPTGDRDIVNMDLINAHHRTLSRVAQWSNTGVKPGQTALQTLQTGSWGSFGSVEWPGGQSETPSDRVRSTSTTDAVFFFLVLVGVLAAVVVGNVLHRRNIHFIPESGVAVLIGVVFGLIIRAVNDSALTKIAEFDPALFVLVFLPIIIFESGFQLQKHPFFSQLGTILALALVGTLAATILTGGVLYILGNAGMFTAMSVPECMTFGALISATDPVATLSVFQALGVTPQLYAVVYGEAVLNDAVGIVLYRTFAKYITQEASGQAYLDGLGSFVGVLLGSLLIGIVFGIAITALFRFVNLSRPDSSGVTETALLLLTAYGSFTLSEAAGLSGIVASLLCGITMNHYTTRVLSAHGKPMSAGFFRMLALVAELTVFFQVGMNVVLYVGVFDVGFVFAACILVLLARSHVFAIMGALNCFRKQPFSKGVMVQVWHAGLRGAIAYALSIEFPSQNRSRVINATSIVIVLTIFLLGGTTTRLMKRLKIPHGLPAQSHEEQVQSTREAQRSSRIKAWFAHIDRVWMRRCLYRPSVQHKRKGLQDGVQLASVTLDMDDSGSNGSGEEAKGSAMDTTPLATGAAGSGGGGAGASRATGTGNGTPTDAFTTAI